MAEDPGKQPDHRMGVKLSAVELKLDYMGSCMLLKRLSDLRIELADEWIVDSGLGDAQPLATTR